MKKKKSKKKIIIGAAAVLVVAGGVTVAGQRNSTENQIPQVQVVIAEKGDVEEIVDATGTVGSEEEKTYYSPVNAELKTVSFAQGDVVKKGTKLIEFNTEDLEKDNRKAELNLKSTKYDTKDTRNKSYKAEKKQKDAKKNVQELEKKIKDKKAYVSSLKSQISAAAAAAQREAAAQASAQAAAQAQAQQQEAQAKAQAEAKKQEEIQSKYQAALYTIIIRQTPHIRWHLQHGRQTLQMRIHRLWIMRRLQEHRHSSQCSRHSRLIMILSSRHRKCRYFLISQKAVQITHGEFQTVQMQMTAMGKILPPTDMITVEVMAGQ